MASGVGGLSPHLIILVIVVQRGPPSRASWLASAEQRLSLTSAFGASRSARWSFAPANWFWANTNCAAVSRASPHPPAWAARRVQSSLWIASIVSMRAGASGGRGVPSVQPKQNEAAVPQTLPWHGPMPQRV